ncbi:MAG: demethylmenaquinone methyltransferase / 2-methoxy-6-polyprenyl,4-benzoquinol methylase [Blastocatellia bacterium]|nr:demethylmenaquinone methyltransferase / 2-methoxy-6-polyprenyl,4-benzoquinol methylase [Blastocatellia bacterium]
MSCQPRGWRLVWRYRRQKPKLKQSNPSLSNENQLSDSRDPDKVREMFGSIARRYDLANHLLSCGCDFIWRKRAAEIVAGWNPHTIVDLATGTGDLALALERALPKSEIIGADFSEEMLAVAKAKGVRRVVTADALALPFADRSFDCLSIAFGLRNIKDWSAALREMSRVLTANGNLLIMEFSLPSMSILRTIYRFYLHRLLPIFGSFLTRKKTAYDYLGDSIERFTGGEELTQLIEANGFRDAAAEPLTGGIVTIYTATNRI